MNLTALKLPRTGASLFGFRTPKPSFAAAFDARRALAFMHIQKTSGSAISLCLKAALAPISAVSGFDLSAFGSFRSLDSIDAGTRCTIYDSPLLLPPNADLIHGHFAFSTLREAYPKAQYITLLREPYSRLLSHWLFWRQHTDAELAPWGDWTDRPRRSRGPLEDFLNDPLVACQTDNLTLRMLLWPHPLIPDDRFIEPANDKQLLREATSRLLKFDFVDIVDGGTFVPRLESWLGKSLHYRTENETRPIPDEFRSPLHRELTADAYDALRSRSRLDLCLWTELASRHITNRDVSEFREQTILSNVARYGVLMSDGAAGGTVTRASFGVGPPVAGAVCGPRVAEGRAAADTSLPSSSRR